MTAKRKKLNHTYYFDMKSIIKKTKTGKTSIIELPYKSNCIRIKNYNTTTVRNKLICCKDMNETKECYLPEEARRG